VGCGEETIDELSVQVTVQVPLREVQVPLREVTVEAALLRSPGGTKPMRRKYNIIPTLDVALYVRREAG